MLAKPLTTQIDGKEISIRTARQIDAENVLKLKQTLLAEGIHDPLTVEEYLLSEEQERMLIMQATNSIDKLILIAEVDGIFAGSLYFNRYQEIRCAHSGEFGLGLLDGFRGLKIGHLLIEALFEWAEEQLDIEKICLKVFAANTDALRLYEKMGFEEEGRLKNCIKMEYGEYVDAILMAKFLK